MEAPSPDDYTDQEADGGQGGVLRQGLQEPRSPSDIQQLGYWIPGRCGGAQREEEVMAQGSKGRAGEDWLALLLVILITQRDGAAVAAS